MLSNGLRASYRGKVAQKKLWVLWSLGIFSVSLQIANIIMASGNR